MNGKVGQSQSQGQQQQAQKCPRCDSMNTKFCYYNNYSLSQPRYFCKSCRRYWTQGGTLRNVRVGGGCRKPKRPKSAANPTSPPPPPPPPEEQKHPPTTATSSPSIIPPLYHGGGYLSSMAAMQSLNQSQPFNQMTNLLSGFGASRQPFYHQMGTEQVQLIQSAIGSSGGSSSTHQHDWTEGFIDNRNSVHHRGSDASLWSTTMSTVSTSGNSQPLDSNNNDDNDASTSVGGSFSLIPNPQWPDLPEYDPPP